MASARHRVDCIDARTVLLERSVGINAVLADVFVAIAVIGVRLAPSAVVT
jgi:hypothetical protein